MTCQSSLVIEAKRYLALHRHAFHPMHLVSTCSGIAMHKGEVFISKSAKMEGWHIRAGALPVVAPPAP